MMEGKEEEEDEEDEEEKRRGMKVNITFSTLDPTHFLFLFSLFKFHCISIFPLQIWVLRWQHNTVSNSNLTS